MFSASECTNTKYMNLRIPGASSKELMRRRHGGAYSGVCGSPQIFARYNQRWMCNGFYSFCVRIWHLFFVISPR